MFCLSWIVNVVGDLVRGEINVADDFAALFFSDAHFSESFRKLFGKTPEFTLTDAHVTVNFAEMATAAGQRATGTGWEELAQHPAEPVQRRVLQVTL